jgi:aminoglycoside phosphotransferase (APT) family kinase protein
VPDPAGAAGVPPAAGVRLSWWAVPPGVRAAVEARLGSRVVDAATQAGGFSPGAAARLRLADGRRAFVKAVGPQLNPHSPEIFRSEARVVAQLAGHAPVPRLLACIDDNDWVALVFEDVDGAPPRLPWRPDELRRVVAAAGQLAATLDPSPIAVASVQDRFGESFHGWRRLAVAGGDLGFVPPWARRHLDALAELEAGWAAAAVGSTLCHCDLRADNLILTDAAVIVVDWPWASIGPPWFDGVAMVPSLIMQGAPGWEPLITGYLDFLRADPAAVTALLAAFAGFFLFYAQLPAQPGLPTLRAFQRSQGEAALVWLRARTGWP